MMTGGVRIIAVPGVPDIRPGDDLPAILGECLAHSDDGMQAGDVACVAHKIVSKAEGNLIRLDSVTPSPEAQAYGRELNKDPRKVEIILGESAKVIRAFRRDDQDEGTMICEHRLGMISANAGVDESNADAPGTVITLPRDPDGSAQALKSALEARFGRPIGIVITDTFGRPWRLGQVNVAVGLAGVATTLPEAGEVDGWGRPLAVTEPALADEIAAASGLVVRKAAKTPLVLMRGLSWAPQPATRARDILRARTEDMFR